MSREYKLDFDGQSVTQDDYNAFGSSAGLIGEKILAELFRLAPNAGSVAKGVLPYGHSGSGLTAMIAPNGANGSVKVNPFRAIIGSRVIEATDAAKSWQDIRSGISVADGASTFATTLVLTANSSGNPRWDGIYAVVTVDSPSTPVTRKVKNPGTGVVTDQSVSAYKVVAVTVTKVDGTPSATPVFPTTPADSGNIYYINLGYIRVPTGFGAGTTVSNKNINTTAPVFTISHTTGASSLRPATGNNGSGSGVTGAGTSAQNGVNKWTGTTNTRPGAYIPPTMVGIENLIVALEIGDASNTNWSHQNGDVVDNSRDWRNRLWRWQAACGSSASNSSSVFPWTDPASSLMVPPENSLTAFPNTGYNAAPALGNQWGATCSGMGSSISPWGASYGVAGVMAAGGASVTPRQDMNMSTYAMATGTAVWLYVDDTTGALKVGISGVPQCSVLFWIEATGQYENV